GVRVKVDDREGLSPGRKFVDWELKGVPLRVEIGPKDIEQGVAVVADRLFGEKQSVPLPALTSYVTFALGAFHEALYQRALEFRQQRIYHAETYEELKEKVELGFVYATHCGDPESEKAIQEETKAT